MKLPELVGRCVRNVRDWRRKRAWELIENILPKTGYRVIVWSVSNDISMKGDDRLLAGMRSWKVMWRRMLRWCHGVGYGEVSKLQSWNMMWLWRRMIICTLIIISLTTRRRNHWRWAAEWLLKRYMVLSRWQQSWKRRKKSIFLVCRRMCGQSILPLLNM